MIVRLGKERQRDVRHRLLDDVVYIISHEALRQMNREGQTELSPVEVYLSAQDFCKTILGSPDAEEGLDDEMDDLEDEATGENDFMLIMAVAIVMLQALSKRHAGEGIPKIQFRIFERLDGNELLLPLMEQMAYKEDSRWMEGKKSNLLAYELRSIGKEDMSQEDWVRVADVVDSAMGLTPEGMQHVENVLAEVNDRYGHRFQKELDRLRQERKRKSDFNINIEKLNDIHDNPNVTLFKPSV